MKFEDYHIDARLKESLMNLGFKRPTDIQFRAIPSILNGEDVMAIAQTGTGKTAAFAIPALHRLLQNKVEREAGEVRCLVMLPTRELALQIAEVFDKLAQYTNLNIVCLHGGTSQDPQIAKLKKTVDVLVATPGRMFDFIKQKHIKITKTELLILDEADQMLALGFYKDIQDVLKFLPKIHQTLFFSATINTDIKDLAYSIVRNPIRIQISPKDRISRNITHAVAFVEMDDKRAFLERLLKEKPESRFLVFVRTKVRVERVAMAMARVGIESLTMHGGKEQEDRLQTLAAFKEGVIKVLIATDVSARGIHIDNVDYVINYDLPDVPENYVHRVGRTGRGVRKGFAFSFCSPEEKPLLKEIEGFLEKPVEILSISKKEYEETVFLSDDDNNNWKKLIKEAEQEEEKEKMKKKKK